MINCQMFRISLWCSDVCANTFLCANEFNLARGDWLCEQVKDMTGSRADHQDLRRIEMSFSILVDDAVIIFKFLLHNLVDERKLRLG